MVKVNYYLHNFISFILNTNWTTLEVFIIFVRYITWNTEMLFKLFFQIVSFIFVVYQSQIWQQQVD